jgi:hypothetical protein
MSQLECCILTDAKVQSPKSDRKSKVQSPMSNVKSRTRCEDENNKIDSLADFGLWTLDFGLIVEPSADGGIFDDDCL